MYIFWPYEWLHHDICTINISEKYNAQYFRLRIPTKRGLTFCTAHYQIRDSTVSYVIRQTTI